MSEGGYAALTFEAVARRAGTSRPVLNRRWLTLDAMAQDAIAHASSKFDLVDPDTGSLRTDVISLMHQLNSMFAALAATMTVQLAAFYGATGTSPAELRERLIGDRWKFLESIVHRAADRGEVDEHRLTPRIVRLPYDLLRHEVLMNLKPMPADAIEDVVDTIFMPLVRPCGRHDEATA